MKRIWALLLSVMLIVSMAVTASAEQATLIFSYGEDAFNKVLLDIKNTVVYKGNTYVFDFHGYEFKEAFPLHGGNTYTVLDVEVPKFRLDMLGKNESLKIGTVTVNPSGKEMTLHVFSGDRVSGQYTLVDTQKTKNIYTQDIYVTPGKEGGLQPIDQVYLFSYREGGIMRYYAGSLYVKYEGYSFDAETNTVDERMEYAPETLISMIRVLEEECNSLKKQLEAKGASASNATEIANLNMKITQLEAEKALLQEELEQAKALAKQIDILKDELKAKNNEIEKLQAELAAGNSSANVSPDIAALARQIVKLEDEKNKLSTKANEATKLLEQIAQLEKQLTEKDLEISRLNAQLTASQSASSTADSGSSDVSALTEQVTLLTQMLVDSEKMATMTEKIAQLENENTALKSNNDQLGIELISAEELIAEKVTAIDTLNAQLEAALADASATAAALNEQVAQLENEKASLQNNATQLTAEIAQAEKLIAEKNARIDTLTAELEAASANAAADASALNAQITQYMNEKTALQNSISQLTAEIAQAEELITEKNSVIDGLNAELEAVSANAAAEAAALNEQIIQILDEKSALQNEAAQLSTEIEQAKALIDEKDAQITSLNTKMSETAQQLEQLNSEKAALLADSEKAAKQISQLQAENAVQKAQITEGDATIEELNAELTKLRNQLAFEEQKASVLTYSDNAPYTSSNALASPESDFYSLPAQNDTKVTGYCGNSKKVIIPNKIFDRPVTSIGNNAFKNCSQISSIAFPDSLQEIGSFAFAWNHGLTGLLDIPASVTHINDGAFKQCGFSGMIINSSFTTANNNPFELPNLEFLFIREGANPVLMPYAFTGCTELKVAVIPASVTQIPDNAFTGCGMLTIVTPAGSAAEAWAIENNFAVETSIYAAYTAQYETLYPAR